MRVESSNPVCEVVSSVALPGETPPDDPSRRDVFGRVVAQLHLLAAALGVRGDHAVRIFDALARETLQSADKLGAESPVSGINGDAIPFQWSVSSGRSPGGLRFVTDCGPMGAAIVDRIAAARSALDNLDFLTTTVRRHVRAAIDDLLPSPDDFKFSNTQMGIWLAGAALPSGQTRLKIYINQEIGRWEDGYLRFAAAVPPSRRASAVARLTAVVSDAGLNASPAWSAVEVSTKAVLRFKLYFRCSQVTPEFLREVAHAAGCEGTEGAFLDPFHAELLTDGSYPTAWLSIELSPETAPTGFKLDVPTECLFKNDVESDQAIQRIHFRLGLPVDEYSRARAVIAPVLESRRVAQIVGLGVSVRSRQRRLNTYFHPLSSAVHGDAPR